jgi:hypothetical protein
MDFLEAYLEAENLRKYKELDLYVEPLLSFLYYHLSEEQRYQIRYRRYDLERIKSYSLKFDPDNRYVYMEFGKFITEEKTISFKTPKTWWQHFKESCFPKWLLRRFPVKYIEKKYFVEKGFLNPNLNSDIFPFVNFKEVWSEHNSICRRTL